MYCYKNKNKNIYASGKKTKLHRNIVAEDAMKQEWGRRGMAAGTIIVRDKVSGRNTHTDSLGTTAETFKS